MAYKHSAFTHATCMFIAQELEGGIALVSMRESTDAFSAMKCVGSLPVVCTTTHRHYVDFAFRILGNKDVYLVI